LVAQVYHSLGVEDEAERARRKGLSLVEERLAREPDDVRARYLGANALVALGEREKGLAWARMARSMDPEDPMLLYNLGCIHALAGDPEEAMDCLERAVAAGLTQRNWFLHDGDLDAVRDLPRFQALMTAMGA
ncbi:MAG TPA: tetratricopeptide repeat protein, partial [Holophagaceae bacterium]